MLMHLLVFFFLNGKLIQLNVYYMIYDVIIIVIVQLLFRIFYEHLSFYNVL